MSSLGAVVSRVFPVICLTPTHLSFLFGQFGSGVVYRSRLLSYILLSFLLLGNQQLSIKGSGDCMCLGDLIPSSSCNEFVYQIQ